jgi:hypothetical protein
VESMAAIEGGGQLSLLGWSRGTRPRRIPASLAVHQATQKPPAWFPAPSHLLEVERLRDAVGGPGALPHACHGRVRSGY